MRFADRVDAGHRLAERLTHLAGQDVVVLGLPRGGVPVAAEVAAALRAPLDVLVVRKLGLPWQPELAMGAIAGVGGALEEVRNELVIRRAGVGDDVLDAVRAREVPELRRREQAYRGDRPALEVRGRTVVVVDDGLATGSTMRAAVAAVREQSPAAVVVAVPVGSPDTCARLDREVDEVVCLDMPRTFLAVGQAYDDFRATSDDEVRAALSAAAD
jgi:predicted phosphoribosyltransferase